MATSKPEKNTENKRSAEEKELLNIIDTIRKTGNLKAIPLLFKMMVSTENDEIQNEISHLIFDIKDTRIIPHLFEAIENPALINFQRVLVSACWESGINYSMHLKFFVNLAAKSDYLTCLECVTVIENMEGPFDEQELTECIEFTKNAADAEEGKFELLHSLWEVLVDFKTPEEF